MLSQANREIKGEYTHNIGQMSPLAQFLLSGGGCPADVQTKVVIECLHWPKLREVMEKIRPFTEHMKIRFRDFKREIRQPEYRGHRWIRHQTYKEEEEI
jgi:hypothetical protein